MKRTVINRPILVFCTVLLCFSTVVEARKSHRENDDFGQWLHNRNGQFDYYLLALSWSPEFCGTPAGQKPEKQQQCSSSLGFVTHGLWPQYNHDGYPQDCGPEAEIPREIAGIVQNIVPPMPPGDPQLLEHEWQKHGTCSGLSMADYFAAIRTTAEKIKIPEALKTPHSSVVMDGETLIKAFAANNPGLTDEMINIETDRQGNISGVGICFDKQLAFQVCEGRHSRQGGVLLPVR